MLPKVQTYASSGVLVPTLFEMLIWSLDHNLTKMQSAILVDFRLHLTIIAHFC